MEQPLDDDDEVTGRVSSRRGKDLSPIDKKINLTFSVLVSVFVSSHLLLLRIEVTGGEMCQRARNGSTEERGGGTKTPRSRIASIAPRRSYCIDILS